MPSTSQPISSMKELNEKVEKEDDLESNSAEQILTTNFTLSIFAYLQILCGCLAIIAGLCAYVVGTWRSEYGIGVWSGILFVASGVTGFIARRRKNKRTLLGFFFVSAFVAGTTINVIIFHVMILRNEDKNVREERLFNVPSFSQYDVVVMVLLVVVGDDDGDGYGDSDGDGVVGGGVGGGDVLVVMVLLVVGDNDGGDGDGYGDSDGVVVGIVGTRRGLDALQMVLALTAFIVLLSGCRSAYIHLRGERFQNTFENHDKRLPHIQCC
ncbi:hypothetical protein HOLleu_12704 [Holothuria leucospilota]|uniref:Transmembrane protein n=1 Tax=Holothuria leucospilota TaxID=206669 RepID=A0A9Q1CBQ0_HOLLE|nr:hypothetical protein HOLleu_12704 [Holothuria leucospilota]